MFFSGGLAEEVDEKVLHAAFIPFGDITDIQIPLDYETGNKHTNIHKTHSYTYTLNTHFIQTTHIMPGTFCPQRSTGALPSSSLNWQR